MRRYEFKFIRKDGGVLWTCVAINPLFDACGRYLGARAVQAAIADAQAIRVDVVNA